MGRNGSQAVGLGVQPPASVFGWSETVVVGVKETERRWVGGL